MEFIKLNCPNCNGIQGRADIQVPLCEAELLLKENKVYHIDQTINNYYGAPPAPVARPKTNVKMLLILPLLIVCSIFGYVFMTNNQSQTGSDVKGSVRTMPESEVLLFFLKDIFNKGAAMPTEEEIASNRYLSTRFYEDQWHLAYSFDDPFTNGQAEITDYVIMDKLFNKQ